MPRRSSHYPPELRNGAVRMVAEVRVTTAGRRGERLGLNSAGTTSSSTGWNGSGMSSEHGTTAAGEDLLGDYPSTRRARLVIPSSPRVCRTQIFASMIFASM